MSIESIKNTIIEYTDLAGAFLTTSVKGGGKLEQAADSFLLPLRLCLTKWEGREVTVFDTSWSARKEMKDGELSIWLKVIGAILALEVTIILVISVVCGIFLGMVVAAGIPIIEAGSIAAIPIGIANAALGVTVTTGAVSGLIAGITMTVVVAIYYIAMLLLITSICAVGIIAIGIILKAISWTLNPAIVDKYLQYTQQEREIVDAAIASRHNVSMKHYEILKADEIAIVIDNDLQDLESLSIDRFSSSNADTTATQSFMEALPFEVVFSMADYLSVKDIYRLRCVSKALANLGGQLYQVPMKKMFANIFGADIIEQIGIDKLMAYSSLHVPYHSFTVDKQLRIQRCGSNVHSDKVEGLKPEDLGDHDVRYSFYPESLIAIRKERQEESTLAKIAHMCGLKASPSITKEYVEVIRPLSV